LVRTALYDDLSATRRQRLHRRAGEALEKLRPADVVALAYHFDQAGGNEEDRARAIRYTLAAAEQALSARALADAEVRFRRALELLDCAGGGPTEERISALCGLGEALRDQGNPSFRDALLSAGRLAQETGHLSLLVRAVLNNSRGVPSVIGGVDSERVAMTEATLDLIGDEPSADRARLLAQLAAEITFSGDYERRLAVADQAEALARAVGDGTLLAWVLNRTGYAVFAADRVERLVIRAREATRLSDLDGDPSQRLLSRYYLSGALLTVGDIDEFRRVTKEMLIVSQDAAPTLQWLAQVTQARVSLLEGDIAGAERINDSAFRLAQQLGEPDGMAWWAAIRCPLDLYRGNYTGTADLLKAGMEQYPDEPAWAIGYALSLAMENHFAEATVVLQSYSPDIGRLLDHTFPMFNIHLAGLTAFHLGDIDLARRTADAVRPFRRCWAHQYAASIGPVALSSALCAATAGNLDEAIALCEQAEVALSATRSYGLMPVFHVYFAEILRRRGTSEDLELVSTFVEQLQREDKDGYGPDLSARIADLDRSGAVGGADSSSPSAGANFF
jgi:ATP/maltotriose-dependent transcriptional regulator MalT